MIGFGVIIVALVFWIISVQRTLVVLDQNSSNAMLQIGVHVSSICDALTFLLDSINEYAEQEYRTIKETIQERRSITKDSSPDDVIKQENIIAEAIEKIMAVADNYPDLKTDSSYIKTMNSVNQYEKIVSTGRLIYNNSVTKFNRAIRMFPTSIAAGILGFSKRAYLEEENQNDTM